MSNGREEESQKIRNPPFAREVALISTDPDIWDANFPPEVRFRGHATSIRPRESRDQYLEARFATHELDSLESTLTPWNPLGFAGLPGHIRPLHRLEAQGLNIVITEEARMHLIWTPHRIFLMPVDPILVDYGRFRKCFCERSKTGPDLYGAALGLLLSYIGLIVFESDLLIAQKHGLMPGGIKIEQWTKFSAHILSTLDANGHLRSQVPGRYHFGMLRLDRVNMLYRSRCLSRGDVAKAIHGYYLESVDYNSFLVRNFRWLAVVFAYSSIVLNALQVGLGTNTGQQSNEFNYFAWVACVLIMAMLGAGIFGVFGTLVIVVVENALFALSNLRRAFRYRRKAAV